ncbi:MAG: hypothetical protein M3112_06665 [Actinomycetia bacterium]|nr:hypothetical protein [Actinomycetes bacterium]
MHLIRRFFGFLVATPLTPSEQRQVRDALAPGLARLFFAQRSEDQRHAFVVYERVESSADLAQAALLHDVGKTDSDLGALERSLATIWDGLGRPTSGRWRSYLAHGSSGARMLKDLGADNLAISFAQDHPGPCPEGIDSSSWCRLESADNE